MTLPCPWAVSGCVGKGAAGGHNGLGDIQRTLGTMVYPRLRVGIDPPGRVPQVDYVVGRFYPDQLDKLAPAIELACDAIETWIKEGLGKAMTKFNGEKE